MLLKKMIAVLSAVIITGTYTAYSGTPCIFTSYAEEEIVSDAESETCGVMVSLSPASFTIPQGITARLVKICGDETTTVEEWELTQKDVKEITGLEYSDDIKYKILIDENDQDYYLPAETNVLLHSKGDVDKIALCGVDYYRHINATFGNKTSIEFGMEYLTYSANSAMQEHPDSDIVEEAYIIDDNGVRYCTDRVLLLPDGHYTAHVKLKDGYRFVKKNTEAALRVLDMQFFFCREMDMSYFDKDFDNGVGFDVINGETDEYKIFYIEDVPSAENCCSADISVVDEDTGELLEGFTFDLTYGKDDDNGSIRWYSSSDNPRTFDKLRNLNDNYTVRTIHSPENYTVPSETKFSFDEYGKHEDVVIKAKRIAETDDTPKVEIPKNDPPTSASDKCSVTAAVIDAISGKPVKGAKGIIYKTANGEKTEVLRWNAEEEPVKTVLDLDYAENITYSFEVAGGPDNYYYNGNTNF